MQIAIEKIHGTTFATPVKLSFFIVDGPNCLLGRYALEQLWPEQYNALRMAASTETPRHGQIDSSGTLVTQKPGTRVWPTSKCWNSREANVKLKLVKKEVIPDSHQKKEVVASSHQQQRGDGFSGQPAASRETIPEVPPCTRSEHVTAQLPEKRKLPDYSEDDILQQEGEAFCRLIQKCLMGRKECSRVLRLQCM